MLNYESIRILKIWGIKISPKTIVQNISLEKICSNKLEIEHDESGYTVTHGGPPYRLSQIAYSRLSKDYKLLRENLIEKIKKEGITIKDFINSNIAP